MFKRLLIASDIREPGGVSKMIDTLARGIPKDDFEVVVALPDLEELKPTIQKLEDTGIGVERLTHYSDRDLKTRKEFLNILRSESPDLVHMHLSHSGSCRSLLYAASKARIPIVATEHDPFKLKFAKKLVKKATLRWTTHTITISDANKEFLMREYKLPESKITRVWNGIEIEKFQNGEINTDELRGFREFSPVLYTNAALHPRKGIKYLLNAIRELLEEFPNLLSLIVGIGPYQEELKDHAKQIGIVEHVRFLGWRDNIKDLLATCDIVIQPSVREAFGLVTIEGMASGKPVIATDIGGHIDIMTNEENGLMIKPKDTPDIVRAIKRLAIDPELRQKLGAAGKARIERSFTIDNMVGNTVEVYKKVLDNNE
jgi:glycosyltransferase involved in cell wall biosynthesis